VLVSTVIVDLGGSKFQKYIFAYTPGGLICLLSSD
jgi:hypothetical protein